MRERVVPIISVNAPWLILAITVSVSLSFLKWADNRGAGAGRFSRGITQLIHPILLDSDRMHEHKRHTYFANPGLSLTRAAHRADLVAMQCLNEDRDADLMEPGRGSG
jgi:hypothetical protein